MTNKLSKQLQNVAVNQEAQKMQPVKDGSIRIGPGDLIQILNNASGFHFEMKDLPEMPNRKNE